MVFGLVAAHAVLTPDIKAKIEEIGRKYGYFTANRFRFYYELIERLKDKPVEVVLDEVNDFWNGVRYASDMAVWGKKDYWATPYSFLLKDRGDCEDYVIAKYFTLKKLGIDSAKLYFVYAKVKKSRVPHMVLAYYDTPESDPLILDNLNLKIFPASSRKDIVPVYTFNGELLERFYDRSKNGLKSKSGRVKLKWDDLIKRMEREPL